MRDILITGSEGFVGKHLHKSLNKKDLSVNSAGKIEDLDLCNWEDVKTLPDSKIIIHLASLNFVPDSFTDPQSFYKNNITSTLNILEKAKLDGSKVIFFSTYVYGKPRYLPIDENHIISPLNPYTHSKVICESLCEAYYRDFKVPVTIFRPFNIYGPGQNSSFFIPTIIEQLNNKTIFLKDSRPRRDFIFIEDLVEAVILSLGNSEKAIRVFNLGSGSSTSVKEIVDIIIQLTNSEAGVEYSDQVRQGEIMDTVADISKIQDELNWAPKTSLFKGLEICVEHYLSRR